jgi:molecular chaperone DnaK
MSKPIGIDLGTTNSVVAVAERHDQVRVIADAAGDSTTPSVICFLPERLVIGAEAKALQAVGQGETAAFFKRHMGDANFLFSAQGRDWTPVDLSALLLARLREQAERALGARVAKAVVTVPAYFRNPHREATRKAAEQAGLELLQLVNEPTAAAIAYGLRQGAADSGKTLLVYDLGGGTFDLTLLRIDADEIRVLNSVGDHELGGKDWDDRLVEWAAKRFEDEFGRDPFEDAATRADLFVEAEQAKKRLTQAQRAIIGIAHGGHRGRYAIERAEFESISADLTERTTWLTETLLDDMDIRAERLDGILLVGGSTRMPMVHDFIRRKLGQEPMTGVNVDEAVARGAALLAAQHRPNTAQFSIGGRRAVDVTNHSLGMIAENQDRTAYINSIILPKNREIPSTERRPFRFRLGRGNRLEIFMTQGESVRPDEPTFLGLYSAEIPAGGQRGEAIVDIDYAYDLSGTVQVSAQLRGGPQLAVKVEPLPDDVPERFLLPPPSEPQPQHISVFLTFDLSGSMAGEPLAEAQRAAHGFVRNLDLTHASVGIMVVADRVDTVCPLCQDARKLGHAIDRLEIGSVGYGNGAHPFDQALNTMSAVSGTKYQLVLADGVWSNQGLAIDRAKRCHKAGIDIIAIGFGGVDQGFLDAIASTDQGSIFTSLEGLTEAFSTIAQELTEGGTAFSLASRK